MLSNEGHPFRKPGRAIYDDACTGAKAAILISSLFTLRRIHPLPCDENMKRIFNILLNILEKPSLESPSSVQVHCNHFRASKDFDSLFFAALETSLFIKSVMMSLLFSMNSMRSWSSSVPSIVKT